VLEEVQAYAMGEEDVGAEVQGPHVGEAGGRRTVEKKPKVVGVASSSLEGALTGPWLDWVYAVDDVVESLTVVFPLADDSLRMSGFDSFVSSPDCMSLQVVDFEIFVLFLIVFSTSTPLCVFPPLVVSTASLPLLILRETSGHRRLMLNFGMHSPTLIFPLPTPPSETLPLPLSGQLY